jgi:hypothetical protein
MWRHPATAADSRVGLQKRLAGFPNQSGVDGLKARWILKVFFVIFSIVIAIATLIVIMLLDSIDDHLAELKKIMVSNDPIGQLIGAHRQMQAAQVQGQMEGMGRRPPGPMNVAPGGETNDS